jgi:uncharacterized protein YbaA (DUF1428 family)
VKTTSGEKVVYSWIQWPSKQVRGEGWKEVIADPRMYPDKNTMPYDNKRGVHRGFAPILDS